MSLSKSFLPAAWLCAATLPAALPYPIVDTHQSACYDADGPIPCPGDASPWSGQDAQWSGAQPSYYLPGDGTVVDRVTGLTWVQARGPELGWEDAVAGAAACRVGGFSDWRMPTVKELYSLMDFRGRSGRAAGDSVPYLDAAVFGFAFGDAQRGERVIDAQDWSADEDGAPTMGGDASVFGVNFIDGRIKSYPKADRRRGEAKRLYARYVRGNPAYGRNDFALQPDGTVLDRATGLDWDRDDSGRGMDWPAALDWVRRQNARRRLGHDDWRLPNAKELQSLVDYRRGPGVDGGPALDPLFRSSAIRNEAGQDDAPFVWSSTTHRENLGAVYIAFGRAMGCLRAPDGGVRWVDVHGAGAQRSDPKTGDAADYPQGRGPQGDAVRILNHVRLVRGGGVTAAAGEASPAAEPAREPRLEPRGEGPREDGGAPDGGGRRPPDAAIDACRSRAEGDPVRFTTPRGDSLRGTCRSRDGLLFAVPDGRP